MSHMLEQYLTNPRILGRLPQVANLLLIVLIAYSGATIFWQSVINADRFSIRTNETEPRQITSPQRRPSKQRPEREIVETHLFGTAQARAIQSQQAPEAPETRLNLTLKGVYATGNDDALAIISSGGRDEEFYKVGDSIPGGAKLKAVYGDRVILERNAQLETLKLPKGKDTGIDLSPIPQQTVSGRGPTTRPASAAHPPAAARTVARPAAAPPGGLNILRQEIMEDPPIFQDMVDASPARQDGRFVGYEVYAGSDDRLFGQLGLRDGDIVTSVNGLELNSPQAGFRAVKNLAAASEIRLVVLRGGGTLTIKRRLNP